MEKILFVGQERSRVAQERNVHWEDEAQCANQLFRALRANKIDPNNCQFVNLFTDESDGLKYNQKIINLSGLNKIKEWSGVLVGLGNLVQQKLSELNIKHIEVIHPAARGAIRLKENYIRHIKENLKKVLTKA